MNINCKLNKIGLKFDFSNNFVKRIKKLLEKNPSEKN